MPIPGSEQQVNAESNGYQSLPQVAVSREGDLLVSWLEMPLGLGSPAHVEARRFVEGGSPIDSIDLQVSPPSPFSMWRSAVTTTEDGVFVVVWEGSYGGYPGPDLAREIRGRRFGTSGDGLDEVPIPINSSTLGPQTQPATVAIADGGFLVVWEEADSEVRGRRLHAGGEPTDPEEIPLSPVEDQALAPSAAPQPDGGFLVAWSNWDGIGIVGLRVASDSSPSESQPFFVNTSTDGYQYKPRIEADPGGDFVVVWEQYQYGALGPDLTVRARRFAADGTPKDLEDWLVSTSQTANNSNPDVAVDSEGNFVVAWTTFTKPGLPSVDATVVARRFRADGTAVDATEHRIPSDDGSSVHEAQPSVGTTPEGDFLAVWLRLQQGGPEEADIWMRRFARPTIQVSPATALGTGPVCTLIEAIEAANIGAAVGGCPAGNEGAVIDLQQDSILGYSSAAEGVNALPVIRRSITIRGFGSRIERDPALPCPGAPDLRLFEVADGGILTLEKVEIAGGCSSGSGGAVFANGGTVILRDARIVGNRAGVDGGGVAVASGNLYVTDSVFSGNVSGSRGGAISVTGATGATRIERSTLSGNTATSGGAVSIESDRIAWLSQSTVVANSASASGGAIRVDAAGARFVLDYSTIAGNAAPQTSGVHVVSGKLLLHGTVVGEGTGGADCGQSGGNLSATRANLDTDGSCAALGGSSVSTVGSFELAALQDQGGPTPVRLPLNSSPLIDLDPKCALASGAPLGLDQRGLPRPSDDDGDGEAACDLGAVERGPIFVDGFESGSTVRWN